jgi:hypothetical protein
VKDGFRYFTGIGTSCSYFQAQKAKNDSILVMYDSTLPYSIHYTGKFDSLQLAYGFKWEYGGEKVSDPVMNLYNSVIKKELLCRLGKDKWNEYCFKADSINEAEEFDIFLKKKDEN